MRWLGSITIVAVVAFAACSRPSPPTRQYELRGQILSINSGRGEVLVDHEDIKGFMPAMTMTYKVNDPAVLEGKKPGDLFTATLVVEEVGGYLSTMTTTGHAPIKTPLAGPSITDTDLFKQGEVVPDRPLVDHTGTPRPLSSLRGHRVALTFIYTRCPLPDFCPLMDKQFAAVQNEIRRSKDLTDVRLVSVTLDPDYDVPAVLERHAKALGAEAGRWYFLTGKPDEVMAFAKGFGVLTERGDSEVVVHNLRTAIVDAQGRLVNVHSGNMWSPAELVADLQRASPPAN